MSKLAVDIVLLPDKPMTDKVLEMNAQLVENFESEIALGPDKYLPHISLCMGVLDEADQAYVTAALARIAAEHPQGTLRATNVVYGESESGKTVSLLEIENPPTLQKLPQRVVFEAGRFLDKDVTAEMVADQDVAETTLEWISRYRAKASFENFFPHITVGYGRLSVEARPMDFVASKLAMCHLGNHCTCKHVLFAEDID